MLTNTKCLIPSSDLHGQTAMLSGSSTAASNDACKGGDGDALKLLLPPNIVKRPSRSTGSNIMPRKKLLCFSWFLILIFTLIIACILWKFFQRTSLKLQVNDQNITSTNSYINDATKTINESSIQTMDTSSISSTENFVTHMTDVQTTSKSVKQNQAKKVLFIIVDGIPADVLENLPVNNMRHIQNSGAYTRAFVGGIKGTYSQTATISSPGYMSLLTGTWGNKHNVYDNYVRNPNYHYKNIFRLVKEQDPTKTIAIFSTWTTNRIKLIGEGLYEAGNITFDYKFDGYELDHLSYPHDKKSVYIRNIDQRVTNETSQCIRTDAPDLSWVYLQYTDDIGHYFGDSDAFNQSILALDEHIGNIWEAIDYRIKYHGEDWLMIITTDHGRDPKTGKHHAGQSVRERTTWIITNSLETNTYFHEFQPAIVDVLPTIIRFLNFSIPVNVERELDGIPFIGNLSLINPHIILQNDSLLINWVAFQATSQVKVWLSTTNQFKKGLPDNYTLVKMVPTDQATMTIDLRDYPSKFYKILLEGQYNMVNRWIKRL